MIDDYYLRQARKLIPKGYYQLTDGDQLRNSDLVFDWTNNQFYRVDWEGWLTSPLVDKESMICAIRKAEFEGFENAQTRTFTMRK